LSHTYSPGGATDLHHAKSTDKVIAIRLNLALIL